MNDIILIGGGGHCKSIIDSIRNQNEYRIVGVLDLPPKIGTFVSEIEIIGTDQDINSFFSQGIEYAFITLGNIGNAKTKVELCETTIKAGFKIPIIADKTAIISGNSEIESGCFIAKGAIININVKIGKCSIINTGAIIEHDCTIESFCHIAPSATLCGGVTVGKNSHIGANATIIQNIQIGNNAIIGAGSVVINDVPENQTVAGVPAKRIK